MARAKHRIVATWMWKRSGWLIPSAAFAGLMVIVFFHNAGMVHVNFTLILAVALPALAAGSRDPVKLGVSRRLGTSWRDHLYGGRVVLLTALSPLLLAAIVWKLRAGAGAFGTVHIAVGLVICASLAYDAIAASGRKSLVGRVQLPLVLAIFAFGRTDWWGQGIFSWGALIFVAIVAIVFSRSVALERWQESAKQSSGDYRVADLPGSHWLFAALILFALFANPRFFGDQPERMMYFLVGGLLLGLLLLLVESLRHLREAR